MISNVLRRDYFGKRSRNYTYSKWSPSNLSLFYTGRHPQLTRLKCKKKEMKYSHDKHKMHIVQSFTLETTLNE